MPRTISTNALRAMYAQETGEIFVILITITHPDLKDESGNPAPLRACTELLPARAPFVSNGDEFVYFPFQIELPLDAADELSQTRLRIDNIDGSIIDAIRALRQPPSVLLQIVLSSTPDIVEAEFDMQLLDIDYDAIEIVGTLGWENILTEPYPGESVTPKFFPGLFR